MYNRYITQTNNTHYQMMQRLYSRLFVFISSLLFTALIFASTQCGYVEKVKISPGNIVVKAKLDTGAVLASLDAVHVKVFKKDKQTWVRFEVPQENNNIVLERQLLRYVKIKTRSGEHKAGLFQRHIRRPVVALNITLGRVTKEIEVNLANRTRFIYPLLLGREALIAFHAEIDPSLTFRQKLKGV